MRGYSIFSGRLMGFCNIPKEMCIRDRAVIKEGDFAAIEAKMLELVAKKEEIKRQDITKADAMKMFGDRGEEYKTELISELEDGTITTYTQGSFTDLCRGPHLPNTSYLKAVKILSVAGAYWRGDEKRKQDVYKRQALMR